MTTQNTFKLTFENCKFTSEIGKLEIGFDASEAEQVMPNILKMVFGKADAPAEQASANLL